MSLGLAGINIVICKEGYLPKKYQSKDEILICFVC